MNAKYKIDSRVHHDGICLTVTRVDYNEYLQQYQYVTRRTDGSQLSFFRAIPENELTPCDCEQPGGICDFCEEVRQDLVQVTDTTRYCPRCLKTITGRKTTPAMMPAPATLRVSEPLKTQFAEGDQVRVNRTRMLSYVQEVRGEDVRLENGNWYHLGELTLFRKAPEKALCSVCEEYRAGIVTRDGVDICQHCTAKAEAPFQVGDWVREKGHPVNVGQITDIITHETGLISHPVTVRFKTTFYRFNLWNARDLEPVDPPVSFVLIGRGELSTARRPVKIAGLLPASCANYPAEKMAYEHALKTFPGTTPYIRVERDGFGIGYVTFGSGEKFYPMKQAWKAMKAHGADNPAVRLDVRGQIVQVRPYEEVAYGVATC